MPAAPEVSKQLLSHSERGDNYLFRYFLTAKNDREYFAVCYRIEPHFANREIKLVYDDSQRAPLEKINAELQGSEEIQIRNHPARKVEFLALHQGQRKYGQMRLVLVDNRMIILGFRASGPEIPADINNYFESFDLLTE
ncbi:MAG: hypothetical protein K1X75_05570 [Leptospirales bacterium]|nr:hypothetical protein [Leptospirales bacterium]